MSPHDRHVSPGGYVEFQDIDLSIYSDDGTLHAQSDLYKWNRLLAQACNQLGVEHSPGPKLKSWMEKAGFVNIVEQVYKLPWGPWPKDKKLKEIGAWNLRQALDGLEGFTLQPLCEVLGWSKGEVAVLLAQVRKDLKSPNIHGYYSL